jgi:hypothetical protein
MNEIPDEDKICAECSTALETLLERTYTTRITELQTMEEFFAKGITGGAVATNATWSPEMWSNVRKPTGIHLTSITPPEQGWPIMAHCSICKKTVIVLSPYAAKPEDGDILSLKGTCLDEDEHIRHNMYP